MLNSSYSLLNTVLKVKPEWWPGSRMIISVSVVSFVTMWLMGAVLTATAQRHMRGGDCIFQPGKDPDLKSDTPFVLKEYRFPVLKNR